MGRRLLCDVEESRPLTREDQIPLFDVVAFERWARQLGVVDPALTRVKAARPDHTGLDRMTWRDHVDFGDSQAPASQTPAWKLGWKAGFVVMLSPAYEGAPPVTARVLEECRFPTDFSLPLMVQVMIIHNGREVFEIAIPVSAIAHVVGRSAG